MNEEITGQQVREWRKANDWTLAELGAALGGLSVDQASKLETGGRGISPSEQRLLRILMFRELPAGFPTMGQIGRDEIQFSAAEWELIGNMARAVGRTPQEWVADRIREYLAYQHVRAENLPHAGGLPETAAPHAPETGAMAG